MAKTSVPNPVADTFKSAQEPVSKEIFVIAGIKCHVYGLKELPSDVDRIACLWLLHPRLESLEAMEPFAYKVLNSWFSSQGPRASPGLIAVSFDQRNHGTRLVESKANDAWRRGNGLHAQDMFSVFQGTALDVSQLITYLPAYAFPEGDRTIDTHLAMGISLGGHCVWHCLLHEPRISTGVVVIGCPDYLSLMTDRARLSKLQTYTESDPPGATFVGSRDFPTGLLDAVDLYDPAGLLTRRSMPMHQVNIIGERLGGKRILNLTGGDDKLVPYAAGKGFLDWFKSMIRPDGPAYRHNILFVDKSFDGVGHEMSPAMVEEAVLFIERSLKKHPAYRTDAPRL